MASGGAPESVSQRGVDGKALQKRVVRRSMSEASEYGIEVVTIHVGKAETNKQTFSAHKIPLTTHSEFFQTILDDKSKEGKELIVSLQEDDPEIFRIFYRFLYTGQIFSSKEGDRQQARGTSVGSFSDLEYARLAAAWCLGEKLLSTSFKDAITDALITMIMEDHKRPCTIQNRLYPKSSATSGIRKLLVDIAIWEWKDGMLERLSVAVTPAQFLFDLAVGLNKTRKTRLRGCRPYNDDACVYHEHGTTKTCYKTMF